MEKIFKEFCKDLPTMVEQRRKFCFLESLKRLFHSVNTSFFFIFYFFIFLKKINIGRKNTSIQWLNKSFQKKTAVYKVSVKREENFNNNFRPVMPPWKGVSHRGNQDSSRVSASVQFRPLLALNSNTKSKPSCASCIRSCPTGLALRTYMCNNVQLRRFTPTNARKIKSANYLHLQTEQLLGRC